MAAGALLLSTNSCDKYLDVNEDPNNLLAVPYELVLPAAELSTAFTYNWFLGIYGSLWAQHCTQKPQASQYTSIMAYSAPATEFNAFWSECYSGALNDYQYVLEESEKVGDWNSYLIATCMQAFNYAYLVDCFDKIPYFEACKGATVTLHPKYDDGVDVYDDLITRLNTAVGKTFATVVTKQNGKDDQVFAGDINKWKAFANTLKLKLYLRQTKFNAAKATTGINACLADAAGFTTASIGAYTASVGSENPLYSVIGPNGLTTVNLAATEQTVNMFTANRDPRISGIYKMGADTVFLGAPYGQLGDSRYTTAATANKLASINIKGNDPVWFFSPAQLSFMLAEAKLFVGQNAAADYEAGVTASFVDFGSTATAAAALLATDSVYEYPSAGTNANKLEAIITQKWIAAASRQPAEAWFDHSKTGYPSFMIPSPDAGGIQMPKRFIWPATELERNRNAPKVQVGYFEPVWWAK
ncbi:hypothetical protein FACS1894201_03310 [Bacteroidia bacterium]|nr:hypothetical protein FACS1894201_03310 [Bacteroidia bacterium]